MNQQNTLIPVTIVTGFLGSGKTTLLNRILKEQHGYKVAVILNEIGDVNLDSELVVTTDGEDLKIMNNGCVCCTVRGDLTRICIDLIQKKVDFNYLVIETTGMANPSPVAQTFFMEESLKKHFYLDSVVTVVDAKHLNLNLTEMKETQEQIGFADVILLNKIDCVSKQEVIETEEKIKSINALAKVRHTVQSNVPIEDILNINAFDLDSRISLDASIVKEYHKHSHDNAIESVYIEEAKPLDLGRLEKFIQIVITELGGQLLRYKGVLNILNEPRRVVFQGVHTNMGTNQDRFWEPNETPMTKMVFIGRHLPKDILKEGIAMCVAKN